MTHAVLLIDDEKPFRVLTGQALEDEGYDVRTASSIAEARTRWRARPADLVVVDRNLPDGDGLELVAELRRETEEHNLDVAILMVTAYADVDHAVEALKRGADDYVTKPVQLPDLLVKLKKAVERLALERRVRALRHGEPDICAMLRRTESPAMRRVLEMAERVAESPQTPVLILGESGSGKDMLARYIHALTPGRSEAGFVDLNCASLSEQLAESELFGHERGAFTDAKTAKRGLLELADGGSLFLDEIGDLGAGIQAKLLRVLETMRFRRVGGVQDRSVDVRILSATNRDLAAAVESSAFRLDLFHRLAVFQLEVPPLRERPEDILELARELTASTAQRLGRPIEGIARGAEQALRRYAFPGNVRELKNVIERGVILERGRTLSEEALGLGARPASARPGERAFFAVQIPEGGDPPPLREVERGYVERVLQHVERNKTRAAKVLGITFPTISKKIQDYGL
jgi:two-component system response regulator AtoC